MEKIEVLLDSYCGTLAARQFGLISRGQALALGLTDDQIQWRLAIGRWERVLPGVYRVAGATESFRQRAMAVALWAGQGAAISHRTAAVLHNLERVGSKAIHVSSARKLNGAPGWVKVHVVTTLVEDDISEVAGIPVTSVPRTLIDLAGQLAPRFLEMALDDGLRRGLTTIPRLKWVLRQERFTGRRGIRTLRSLVGERDDQAGVEDSDLEAELFRILVRGGLPVPLRHYEVWHDGVLIGEADLYYPQARLVVEADDYWSHGTKFNWNRDYERDGQMDDLDLRVLRFNKEQIRLTPAKVVARVRRALERAEFTKNRK